MEGGVVFDNPSITCVMPPHDDPLLDSLWIPTSSAPFHGSTPMVNFEGENATNINKPFLTPVDKEETDEAGEGDEDDRSFHPAGKKRRLTIDQVQFLERSFEVENKLEPDRKLQLAKELNLQPRQVAIWFQNRRARYKTKQLEKDYDLLKSSYHKLKVDYETLQNENEKLKHEVLLLTEKLVEKEEKSKGNSDPCEPKLDVVDSQTAQKTTPIVTSQNVSKNVPETVVCKQEDANSAKSDVLDSDSPHYSSHVFEQDHSDFSQDDEDNFRCSFLSRPPRFPKIEDESFIDPIEGSCDLMYPVEDQPFWPWL